MSTLDHSGAGHSHLQCHGSLILSCEHYLQLQHIRQLEIIVGNEEKMTSSLLEKAKLMTTKGPAQLVCEVPVPFYSQLKGTGRREAAHCCGGEVLTLATMASSLTNCLQ